MTADDDFVALAEATLDELLELRPEMATALGDHRFDDRLADLSSAGAEHEATWTRRRLAALDALDTGALSRDNAVDAAILRNRLELRAFELEELREREWNPLVWNPADAIYALVARAVLPADVRLRSVVARLAGVPARLDEARRALGPMPRVHVETAIGQFGGAIGLITTELDALAAEVPALRRDIEAVRPAAVEALEDHRRWLEAQLDAATLDPRIGEARHARKFALTLDTDTPTETLRRRAEEDVDRVTDAMAACAERLFGHRDVRRALDQLAESHPDAGTIVPLCRDAVDETASLARELDLVTLPDRACEVIVMPESRRGVAVAYCDSPGPLETAAVPTFFAVAPAPRDWPAARVESFYREYNAHMVRNLTVHEAVPGHYVQVWHSARHRGTTRVRAAFRSGAFAEGWAVVAEEVMADHGYGGDQVRMQQLKMQLRVAINAILDTSVHAGMDEVEAMALMTERGFQEQGEAAGKWRRALLTSAQLSTYFAGYHGVRDSLLALRRARPGATARAVHDELLAHGSPPPRHLPALLGV